MIDPRLLEIFTNFDTFCRKNSIRYNIISDASDRQTYMIKLGDDVTLEEHMAKNVGKMVSMNVDRNNVGGTIFDFGLKVIGEDQYKSPTRRMIQKQSQFRSSFGPSRSFGGISGYKARLGAKISEAFKLNKDLIAHDNATVIPAKSEIEIHDKDPRLPDVKYGCQIINVDRKRLEDSTSKAFEDMLDEVLGIDVYQSSR